MRGECKLGRQVRNAALDVYGVNSTFRACAVDAGDSVPMRQHYRSVPGQVPSQPKEPSAGRLRTKYYLFEVCYCAPTHETLV